MMQDFYDRHFAAIVRSQDPAQIARNRDFILGSLEAGPGSRILDIGCGIGQYARALAQAGHELIGVDLNAAYIAEAERMSSGLSVSFHCADARSFVATPPVDAAICWHSSFGHFEADSDNLALLRAAWASLAPGGRLLLDYANFYRTLIKYQPSFIQPFTTFMGELRVERRSRIDPAAGLLIQDWEYRYANGERALRTGSLRIYLPDRLEALLAQAGFELLRVFGDTSGAAFSVDSPRWIGLARRPA